MLDSAVQSFRKLCPNLQAVEVPLDNDGFTLSPLATAAGSLGPLVASELLSSYLYPSTYRPKMFDSDADVKAKPSLHYGRDIAAPPPPNFRMVLFNFGAKVGGNKKTSFTPRKGRGASTRLLRKTWTPRMRVLSDYHRWYICAQFKERTRGFNTSTRREEWGPKRVQPEEDSVYSKVSTYL